MREAAHRAERAAAAAMREYRKQNVVDEDDLTGELVGELNAALRGKIGSLKWGAKILRHRSGVAAEEKRVGADLLIHVSVRSRGRSYSKGVLIQAKRVGVGMAMSTADHTDLIDQCKTMLSHTPESYVFDYDPSGLRVGSATRVAGTKNRNLREECTLTPFRFFFDLFMCPAGDPRIKSTKIGDLPVPERAEVARVLDLTATGAD